MPPKSADPIKHSLAPWISVPVGAIDFYKSAFDATEVYHHNDPSGGVVVRLSVNGAEFWLSQEPPASANTASSVSIGGGILATLLPDLPPGRLAPSCSNLVTATVPMEAVPPIPADHKFSAAVPPLRRLQACVSNTLVQRTPAAVPHSGLLLA